MTRFKTLHSSHSGRLRPHEFTSYPMLFVMLLFVGFALTVCSVSAKTPYDGPEAGSVALNGTMPGPPPSQAAVITSPSDGASFSTSPVSVKGTCPKDTLVEIFKNDIFAGSTVCASDGTFSLDVDLLSGKNILMARDYDALNQPGPDSKTVTVNYNFLGGTAAGLSPINLSGAQLLLNSDAVYRGTFPGQTLSIPISIIGGTPPFAVNVQWGDSSNKIIPRANNLTFEASHVYNRAGIYQITIQVTDGQSRVAYLTVAAIINGQPGVAGTTGTNQKASLSKLVVLWPLYAMAATMVVSFWLGERREKRVLRGPTYTFHPQT